MKAFTFLTIISLLIATSSLRAESSDSPPSNGRFYDFLKGCFIVGGAGAGGTMLAVSSTGGKLSSSEPMVVAAITSCVIGGFMAIDVHKKAEMKASGPLTLKNQKLKNSVYSVMHDLCVMKKECGFDGLPLDKTGDGLKIRNNNGQPSSTLEPLKSGN
ncbi:MAG: hypothetical protein EOP06_09060 [Proteobacteria bacterium]|nr:MAG: hypothetical protein EOP06_09060 [Pseudomonadota bacterium]